MGKQVLSAKDREFAYSYLSNQESYHSYKESSAFTIFAIEIGFFGALLTTNWFHYIDKFTCNARLVSFAFVFPIWIIAHTFMRWQLRIKRLAALKVSATVSALLDNLKDAHEIENIVEWNKRITWVIRLLDHFIPIYRATPINANDIRRFPNWFQNRFIFTFKNTGGGSLKGEWFPTLGSLLIMLYLGIYIFIVIN